MENVYVRAAIGGIIGGAVGWVVGATLAKIYKEKKDASELQRLQEKAMQSSLKAEQAIGKVLGGAI